MTAGTTDWTSLRCRAGRHEICRSANGSRCRCGCHDLRLPVDAAASGSDTAISPPTAARSGQREPRSWVLDLPDQPFVSSNDRPHWSERARCAAGWRQAAAVLARQQHIPPLHRIDVALDWWPPTHRRRDPDNLIAGVLKPIVDGLIDAGVIPDDTAEHVTRRFPTIHEPRYDRRAVWRLTVTEIRP
jgi:crossover junction endodeoxyribonuclease RusA